MLRRSRGKDRKSSMRRFRMMAASWNARARSSSEPSTAAGSGTPPVRRHGPAGPDRANFSGSAIANGKDEIEFRCTRPGIFIPAFAAIAVRRHFEPLQHGQGQRVHLASGLASCGIRPESALCQSVEQAFCQDGAGGIARADEQCVGNVFRHEPPQRT